MRKAAVYNNDVLAGILTEVNRNSYIFKYDDIYFADKSKNAISLTIPKTNKEHFSKKLFPFFSNLIAEGANLSLQKKYLKIDGDDYFSFLVNTNSYDSIGSVTVKLLSE